MKWQPIENAPSDVKVLLWAEDGHVVGQFGHKSNRAGGPSHGFFAWLDSNGDEIYEVTHWMPLPIPPKV